MLFRRESKNKAQLLARQAFSDNFDYQAVGVCGEAAGI